MSELEEPLEEEIDQLYSQLLKEAKQGGYNLNPDIEFVKGLVKGLIVNDQRYGYKACPCRLAANDKAIDLDIICPCNYRDEDITEFGACYCALYISKAVLKGEKELSCIPERRPPLEERQAQQSQTPTQASASGEKAAMLSQKLSKPVWRCAVCGYLCARDGPPEICPICKVGKERFERFI